MRKKLTIFIVNVIIASLNDMTNYHTKANINLKRIVFFGILF